jgi:hypothetical protein
MIERDEYFCSDCEEETEEIVFHCCSCDVAIIRNSPEHDECNTEDGETWYCGDCDPPSLDSAKEMGESDKEQKRLDKMFKVRVKSYTQLGYWKTQTADEIAEAISAIWGVIY